MSDPDSKLEPGTVLDERYELADEIARGGFGMVYRARQMNMDREVAIKMVPPEFMDLPDVVQRFEREARLASRLNHPNTITVHDYGQHGNYLFLVMELLEGEDLADILAREESLPLDRIARIARQVLKSLHEAHQQNIVHRDLKPENIFLTEISGEKDFVKVVDFGIAKLAMPEVKEPDRDTARRLTIEGNTVGTPTYMSPEQAAGGEVDARSDLYGLGVILYEMAAGYPPFDVDDAAKLMRQHIFKEIPPFEDENLRGCWLESIIRRAMAKEKEDRFQDANEFIEAIDYALDAADDERAFAPTQEQEAVDTDAQTSRDLEEDSLQFLNPDGERQHTDQEVELPSYQTPSEPPRVDSEADRHRIAAPSEASNTSSSILTVLEPSPNEDVIVLDEPKEDGRDPAMERGRAPVGRPLEEADPSPSNPDAMPGASVEESTDGGRAPETNGPQEEWSWSGEDSSVQTLEDEVSYSSEVDSGASRWIHVVFWLLIILTGIALGYLYVTGQAPF